MTQVILTRLIPGGKTPPATSSQHAGPSTPRSLQGSSSTTASGTSSHAGPRGTKRKMSSDSEDEDCTIGNSDRQKRARADADPTGSVVSAEWDASINDDAFAVQSGPTEMDTEFWDACFASDPLSVAPDWTEAFSQNITGAVPSLSEADPPSPTFFDVEEDEDEDDDSDLEEVVLAELDASEPSKKEQWIWKAACKFRIEKIAEGYGGAAAICKAVQQQARPFLTSVPAWYQNCGHYLGKGKTADVEGGPSNVPAAPIVQLPRLSAIVIDDFCEFPAPVRKGTPPRVRREARGSLRKNPLTKRAYH